MRRVFVVEDHPFMRRSIVAALERERSLQVCGEADEVSTAFDRIIAAQPDIVLTDLELESSSGLELIQRLSHHAPALPVVATTMFDLHANEQRARAAGAHGFVAKQEGPEKMIEAIRRALEDDPT